MSSRGQDGIFKCSSLNTHATVSYNLTVPEHFPLNSRGNSLSGYSRAVCFNAGCLLLCINCVTVVGSVFVIFQSQYYRLILLAISVFLSFLYCVLLWGTVNSWSLVEVLIRHCLKETSICIQCLCKTCQFIL